jgi:hypothetical protein
MEKTMTMNVKVVGSEETRSRIQGTKRSHVTIWNEIFRDVRSQWVQAEQGTLHRTRD